ncbi:MAG: D-serine ammonia-lyase [Tissierellia bacterium]|nr:D-serine ammonia-lyase [Tissierellia bacterium]
MMDIIEKLKNEESFLWLQGPGEKLSPYNLDDLERARDFMQSFAPFLMEVFPETLRTQGRIVSELKELPQMQKAMEMRKGRLFGKLDNDLPVAGSIKARGGFYEVLHHARSLAEKEGFYKGNPLNILNHREFFHNHEIEVASTGNLGLSIGLISASLGFKVSVHMSADAKQWKKDLLREKGAQVFEYPGDYSAAVEEARASSMEKGSYFVDDEKSPYLFMGYALAAYELKEQLEEKGIGGKALYVYLPCGVGGAPGGIAYGLSLLLPQAKVYFAEPTKAPAVLLGMLTGKHDGIRVADIGLSGKTDADGLAVGRASSLVGPLMVERIEGVYTLEDDEMLGYLKMLYESEGLKVEPSACAGFKGAEFIDEEGIHLAWITGGKLVPEENFLGYLKKAKDIQNS